MSDEAAWEEMWDRQRNGAEMFANAELTEEKEFRQWNGHNKPETTYTIPAGGTVIITMVSRFGHACIRGRDIDKQEHGYDGCIEPEKLKNVRFLSPQEKGWRQQMREDIQKNA